MRSARRQKVKQIWVKPVTPVISEELRMPARREAPSGAVYAPPANPRQADMDAFRAIRSLKP